MALEFSYAGSSYPGYANYRLTPFPDFKITLQTQFTQNRCISWINNQVDYNIHANLPEAKQFWEDILDA